MYIVTRSDLPVATQAVQAAHAGIAFAYQHHAISRGAGTVIILAAKDELALWDLTGRLLEQQVPYAVFCEEDLDDALTAVAFAGAHDERLRFRLAPFRRKTMFKTKPRASFSEVRHEELMQARRELSEARREIAALQGLLDGKVPGPASWLMSKVARQRTANDRLVVRNTALRAVLRAMNVKYEITEAEWRQIRLSMGPKLCDRMPERVPKADE